MSHSSFLRRFAAADGAPPTARQLYKAFNLLGSDFNYYEQREEALQQLADFTRRWGKPSLDNLLEIARRFAPGQPRSAPEPQPKTDRMAVVHPTIEEIAYLGPGTPEETDTTFALAALSVIRNPEAPNALAPYLASPYAIERWLATIGLVAMHDERALPILEPLLIEFVGPLPPRRPDLAIGYIFEYLRYDLLRLMADWGDSRVVPPIRAGLIANVRAEEIEVPEPHGPEHEFMFGGERFTGQEAWQWFYYSQLNWVDEEHRFIYALGRLGAFGALNGVSTRWGVYSRRDLWISGGDGEYRLERRIPESHAEIFRANIWRVHMCFGALESQFRGNVERISHFADFPELAESVERFLAEEFKLDEAARRRAMWDYDQAGWVSWTVFQYAWETESARERAMWQGDYEEEEEEWEDDEQEEEEQEPEDPPEISLEDREAQDFGWEDQG
ncbi:MAG TPA: hypothetical protein VFW17_17025 [Ktedonobacterales bacterium]|nr:hypothetical protein [Ktedonobacterales bacterium]